MLKLLGKIPNEVLVAVSGGADSMAVLDFIRRGNRKVGAIFIHHGTIASTRGLDVVCDYCSSVDIKLHIYNISLNKPKKQSWEEFWRYERYKIFNSYEEKVITAHHLSDILETWIFTCSHGNPQIIPYQNKNVIRPFLLNQKKVFKEWVENKKVPFTEDPSNDNEMFMRNYIRKNMVENFLHVNPGIYKTLSKKVQTLFAEKDLTSDSAMD